MNPRFPQFLGFSIALAALASVGLPRAWSGPVENTFQFAFAPIAVPVQRALGDAEATRVATTPAEPIHSAAATDSSAQTIARLESERRELERYAASLREQLETLRAREREYERVGEKLRDLVHTVSVVGVDASGRDVIRLAATSVRVEPGAAVAFDGGLVGRVKEVGAANQSNVQLITDKGFKLIGRFIRPRADANGTIEFDDLRIEPTLVEGMGGGEMRIDSLKNDVVAAAGLRVGDIVVLADDNTGKWQIELHGQRVGRVSSVGSSVASQGIAEVRVRPERDLKTLSQAWLILPPQAMPARQ